MSRAEQLWQRLGGALVDGDPDISWSTMMGFPCLRYEGAFFASLDHRSEDLVVKLPADEVTARIEAGTGKPFAPAGKVFREWVAIAGADESTWRSAMHDALDFARSKG